MTAPKKEISFKLVETEYEYDYGVNYKIRLFNINVGKNKFSLLDLYLQQYLTGPHDSFKDRLLEYLRSEFSARVQIIGSRYYFQVFALRVGACIPLGDIKLTLLKYDKAEERKKWEDEIISSFEEGIS
jgi:hypothetical protein